VAGTGRAYPQGLGWVKGILWGDPRVHVRPGDEVPDGARPVERFIALPGPARPRLLAPLSSGPAASAALRQFNNSMSQHARVGKALLGLGIRSRIARRFLGAEVTILVDGEVGPDRLAEVLLEEHLREVLGRRDLHLAITLGRLRPNAKPVIQVLSGTGHIVAYAKVGWNDLTRRLVRNEARVLESYPRERLGLVRMPELLHHGEWNGLEISLTSPLPHPLLRRGRRSAPPPTGAPRAVAHLLGVEHEPLGASRYLRSLRAAIEDALAEDPSIHSVADGLENLERRHGELVLAFGCWHGDWAPWNMASVDGRLFVWDWERSRDPVPVGLDVVHFHFQTAFQSNGRRVREAAQAASAASRAALGSLGVPERAEGAIIPLYLMEIFLRYDEARRAGVLGDETVRAALARAAAEGTVPE
jgi:hypothetical protein